MAAAALALYVFAVLANLIVFQYAAGVLRTAVDEGAREGASAAGGTAACLERLEEVRRGLLGGPYGDRVEARCRDDGVWMRASVSAVLGGFVPPVPDVTVTYDAIAAREGS